MTVKELCKKVGNDNADFLCYLWGRWQDEKEYEDIQNYLKAIQKSIPEAFKITKRPFGIICKCDDGNVHIQIKRKGNGLEIVGKRLIATEKYFAFVVTKDNRAMVGYIGTEGEVLVIPATFQGEDGEWYKVVGIGEEAFWDCKALTSVTIPDSVTFIGEDAFYGCKGLTSVTIPDSVTSIGGGAFDGCTRLTSVTIPDSVASIGRFAFYGCPGLTSVIIPDSVTSIGEYAFYGCLGLASLDLGGGVQSIDESVFDGCSGLTSVTIPDSVTFIGEDAFYGCKGLTSVTIPDSVTFIGEGAFNGCVGLKVVYYTGSKEQWETIAIRGHNKYLVQANITYNYTTDN